MQCEGVPAGHSGEKTIHQRRNAGLLLPPPPPPFFPPSTLLIGAEGDTQLERRSQKTSPAGAQIYGE